MADAGSIEVPKTDPPATTAGVVVTNTQPTQLREQSRPETTITTRTDKIQLQVASHAVALHVNSSSTDRGQTQSESALTTDKKTLPSTDTSTTTAIDENNQHPLEELQPETTKTDDVTGSDDDNDSTDNDISLLFADMTEKHHTQKPVVIPRHAKTAKENDSPDELHFPTSGLGGTVTGSDIQRVSHTETFTSKIIGTQTTVADTDQNSNSKGDEFQCNSQTLPVKKEDDVAIDDDGNESLLDEKLDPLSDVEDNDPSDDLDLLFTSTLDNVTSNNDNGRVSHEDETYTPKMINTHGTTTCLEQHSNGKDNDSSYDESQSLPFKKDGVINNDGNDILLDEKLDPLSDVVDNDPSDDLHLLFTSTEGDTVTKDDDERGNHEDETYTPNILTTQTAETGSGQNSNSKDNNSPSDESVKKEDVSFNNDGNDILDEKLDSLSDVKENDPSNDLDLLFTNTQGDTVSKNNDNCGSHEDETYTAKMLNTQTAVTGSGQNLKSKDNNSQCNVDESLVKKEDIAFNNDGYKCSPIKMEDVDISSNNRSNESSDKDANPFPIETIQTQKTLTIYKALGEVESNTCPLLQPLHVKPDLIATSSSNQNVNLDLTDSVSIEAKKMSEETELLRTATVQTQHVLKATIATEEQNLTSNDNEQQCNKLKSSQTDANVIATSNGNKNLNIDEKTESMSAATVRIPTLEVVTNDGNDTTKKNNERPLDKKTSPPNTAKESVISDVYEKKDQNVNTSNEQNEIAMDVENKKDISAIHEKQTDKAMISNGKKTSKTFDHHTPIKHHNDSSDNLQRQPTETMHITATSNNSCASIRKVYSPPIGMAKTSQTQETTTPGRVKDLCSDKKSPANSFSSSSHIPCAKKRQPQKAELVDDTAMESNKKISSSLEKSPVTSIKEPMHVFTPLKPPPLKEDKPTKKALPSLNSTKRDMSAQQNKVKVLIEILTLVEHYEAHTSQDTNEQWKLLQVTLEQMPLGQKYRKINNVDSFREKVFEAVDSWVEWAKCKGYPAPGENEKKDKNIPPFIHLVYRIYQDSNQEQEVSIDEEDHEDDHEDNMEDSFYEEAATSKTPEEKLWDKRFNELVEFYTINGHCNVPIKYEINPALSRWIKKQKNQYQIRKNGETALLDDMKIHMLEEIGFDWEGGKEDKESNDELWQQHYDELKDFKKQEGHTRVPFNYIENPRLGCWVKVQRIQHKFLDQDKSSQLTDERLKALKDIDFEWKESGLNRACKTNKRNAASTSTNDKEDNIEKPLARKRKFSICTKEQGNKKKSKICHNKQSKESENSPKKRGRPKKLQTPDEKKRAYPKADWLDMFDKLVQYHTSVGHSNVPAKFADDPSLASWVEQMREEYSDYADGKSSQLNEERIDMLESLDFLWESQIPVKRKHSEVWEQRYNELKAFKEKEGHTKVPVKYPENPHLGWWVYWQRMQFKFRSQGKPSQLTDERLQALHEVGFEWKALNRVDWKEKYDELVEFKEENGHCYVPWKWKENPSLSMWVSKQKQQYKNMQDGKQSYLTEERIKLLDDIGFEWRGKHRHRKLDINGWMQRFEELKEFKLTHGHCDVPSKYDENNALGTWVKNQRTQYRKKIEGRGTHMNDERMKLMNDIGFDWNRNTIMEKKGWLQRYEELREFYVMEGHCLVPREFKPNPFLYNWVRRQRIQYKLMKEGKPTQLSEENIKCLEELDFDWLINNEGDPENNGADVATAATEQKSKPTGNDTKYRDQLWNTRYDELKQFKAACGHCRVPWRYFANLKLSDWVHSQRQYYRWRKEGKPSPLTNERLQLLNEVEFLWEVPKSNMMGWYESYDKLKAFHSIEGHCRVPKEYNESLSLWVKTQRKQYNKMKEREGTAMTPEKVQKLEALGFEWQIRDNRAWMRHYEELKRFKEREGHLDVPGNGNPLLSWVSEQRRQYRALRDGKNSSLTTGRLQSLNELGFEWGGARSPSVLWNKRFRELIEFKEKEGHCKVPFKFAENRSLGIWVCKQRRQYKLMKEGKKSSMTIERLESLRSIGFEATCENETNPLL